MHEFKIILEELEIKMFLGLHEFEKKQPQRVLVTTEIIMNRADFPDSGFLDYDAVTEFIRTFNGSRIETQEELVETIHGFILSQGARSATVYSRKPDVYKDCKSVGVCYSG